MSTKYIASNWRLPNEENSGKSNNYGLSYDGSEFINIGNEVSVSGNCTVAFWFKVPAIPNASPEAIFARYTGSSDTDFLIIGLYLQGVLASNNSSISASKTTRANVTLSPNTWHHCAVTKLSGVVTNIYIDGTDRAGSVNNFEWWSAGSTNSGFIGQKANSDSLFDGDISEVAIFDYALSELQISTLYGSSSLGAGNPMSLKPQPVAYYPLGDNSASNPLTQPNEAVEDASVFDFDGSNDFINCGSPSIFDNLTSLSISCWFNSDLKSQDRGILGKWLSGTDRSFALNLETSGNIRFVVRNSSQTAVSTYINTSDWSTGNWYNIIGIYDGANVKVYLDGVLKDTASLTGTVLNTTHPFRIGKYHSSLPPFSGKISNVAIWNSDQSSEISNIYNSGVPATSYTNTPTAWYKLDQSANWEADSTGAWQIPDAVSAYPQSFDFDGNDDLISSPLTNVLNSASEATLSFWAKKSSSSNDIVVGAGTAESNSFYILWYLNGYVYFGTRATGATGFNISHNFSGSDKLDKWHHFVGVYNSGTASLYINGSLVTGPTSGGPTALGSNIDSTFKIGRLGNVNTYKSNGKTSNVQVFNTALPATGTDSVETLYNNGVPLTTAIASDNLKAWYKLDNTELFDGTNWSVKNQKYPAGFDSALSFDGNNDTIQSSAIIPINSVSLWFKPNSTITTSTGSGALISFGTTDFRNAIYLGSNFGAISNELITITNQSLNYSYYAQASGTIDTNWHHLAIVHDGSKYQIYLDGLPVTTTGSTPLITSQQIVIGARSDSSSYFNGEISNIAIFNTTLDSAAVQALYNNGTPETSISSSPVSWWKLDNTTTGIQDSAGSNDGTNNGATKVNTFVSTEAGISSGMTEQNLVNNNVSALNGESSGMTSANLVLSDLTRNLPYDSYSFNFDSASSDYIDTSSLNSTIQTQTSGAISLWIYPTIISGTKYFIGYSNSSTTVDFFEIGTFTSGKLRLLFRNDASGTAWPTNGVDLRSNASVISTNNWYHICIVSDSSAYTVYLNGVPITMNVDAGSNSGKWFGDFSGVTMNNLYIGASSNSGGVNLPFDGKINNFAVFNEALTSTEVLKLYANGVPQDLSSFTPQPVAWYPLGSNSFWNGSQWTVRDMIGSNDGTGQNIGIDGLVGDAPRSEANGTGTNMDIPTNLEGSTKWSDNNSWSINMSESSRVENTP